MCHSFGRHLDVCCLKGDSRVEAWTEPERFPCDDVKTENRWQKLDRRLSTWAVVSLLVHCVDRAMTDYGTDQQNLTRYAFFSLVVVLHTIVMLWSKQRFNIIQIIFFWKKENILPVWMLFQICLCVYIGAVSPGLHSPCVCIRAIL